MPSLCVVSPTPNEWIAVAMEDPDDYDLALGNEIVDAIRELVKESSTDGCVDLLERERMRFNLGHARIECLRECGSKPFSPV